MDKDYIIGIDFGASETSASIYDKKGQISADNGPRLHHLSIVNTGNVSKVYSAIRKVNKDWRLLIDPTDFSYSDLGVDFKRKPSEMENSQKESNKIFWQCVFDSILESNREILSYNRALNKRNFILCVARPSSWSEEDEAEYKDLMLSAGLPVDVIAKESDAALVKWEGKASQNNVLVVDCGSSTIDLTLSCNGETYDGKLFTGKEARGAERIEELLLEHFNNDKQFILDCNDVRESLIQNDIDLDIDDVIRLYLRNTKERYYTFSPDEIEFSLKKYPFTKGDGNILNEYMENWRFDRIVAPYFNELSLFFDDVRKTLGKANITVDSIILCGGASRMPRVKDILQETFGLNDTIFHDKNEADYVVSDGLALLPGYQSKGKGHEKPLLKSTDEGHAWVDIGLSVKWATCNIGANSPEEFGDFFAWGEISTKKDYSEKNYCKKNDYHFHKDPWLQGYCKDELDLSDDVARVLWGGGFRMPTLQEMCELMRECDWEWVDSDKKKGYKVKSRVNGNSIFLPSCGAHGESKINLFGKKVYFQVGGSGGYYWTASLNTDDTLDAHYLDFGSWFFNTRSERRFNGFSVRAVKDDIPITRKDLHCQADMLDYPSDEDLKRQFDLDTMFFI